MKKFRGKALAALLSLALVASSFPVTLASASTKHASGVLTDDPDYDEFWLVNGGDKDERSVENFQDFIFTSGNAPLETADHQDVDDPVVYSISHVSGDKLVSWKIGDDDDDDDDGEVKLSLRKSDSEGDEVLAVLYRGTYTDDDDNDVYVTASTEITIHAVDKDATVVGDADDVTSTGYYNYDTDLEGTDSPELDGDDDDDDNFAKVATAANDCKAISVFMAEKTSEEGNCLAQWKVVPTAYTSNDSVEDDIIDNTDSDNSDYSSIYYALESSNDDDLDVTSTGVSTIKSLSNVTAASTTTSGAVTVTNKTTKAYMYSTDGGTTKTALGVKTDAGAGTTEIAGLSAGDEIDIYNPSSTAGNDDTPIGKFVYRDSVDATTGFTDYVYATVLDDAGTASVTFKGKVTDKFENNVADDDDIKAKVKIEKKVLANDTIGSNDATYTIYKDDDNDYQIKLSGNTGTDANNGTTEIDSGFIVKFAKGTTGYYPTAVINDDASVDGVKGYVTKLTIDDAKKVGDVDLKAGDVSVEDSDVKVDSITTKEGAEVSIDADNDVGAIEIKDDTGDSTVTMTSGSATSITSKGTIDLEGSEDDEPITVGTVSGQKVTIDSDDGAVTVSNLVVSAPTDDEGGCTIELIGDQATIKAIDFAGYGVDMQAEDFQGELPSLKNATSDDATFETTDEDDDVTFTGDVDIDAVSLEDDSKVVFDGALDVNDLDGSGIMYIGANKLYVGDDASSVLVKLTDTTLAAGDTVFTAANDAVDDDDLDFYGFTVSCNEGSTTDTFVVDQLEFAGLALNKTSSKIVLDDSETFTASAYAPGTSLPDGYSMEFSLDDNSGVFELTDNGDGTATVKCVDYDSVFSSENKATLEAYVVDEDGDEDDDYGVAECNLTALKTAEQTWSSDTTVGFTLAPGASYQFDITATTAPTMTAGTDGVVSITNVGKSGDDYFIKVTAAADANGKETGLYVDGTKLLVVKVSGTATFTSDTTTNVTVKKGSSYQYKITSTTTPTFGFGTSGVFTSKLLSQSGNNYFYQITAVGAAGTQTGVYVNGTKVNVATVS